MGYRAAGMQLTENKQIHTILAFQLVTGLAVGLLLLVFGKSVAFSGLMGGMIAALSSGYLAIRSLGHYRAQEPERVAGRMLRAEIQKLVLIGLMFLIVIVYIKPSNFGILLGSYLIVQMGVPLVVTFIKDRQQS